MSNTEFTWKTPTHWVPCRSTAALPSPGPHPIHKCSDSAGPRGAPSTHGERHGHRVHGLACVRPRSLELHLAGSMAATQGSAGHHGANTWRHTYSRGHTGRLRPRAKPRRLQPRAWGHLQCREESGRSYVRTSWLGSRCILAPPGAPLPTGHRHLQIGKTFSPTL